VYTHLPAAQRDGSDNRVVRSVVPVLAHSLVEKDRWSCQRAWSSESDKDSASGRRWAASRREKNARKRDRATSRTFRSARRNAGYNLIDLARGGGILQVLKTTAHQTAMLARPRFTCLGTVARANRRAARDVTRLYRRMNAAHVTQQSRWACETSISRSACRLPSRVVHSPRRSVIVVAVIVAVVMVCIGGRSLEPTNSVYRSIVP